MLLLIVIESSQKYSKTESKQKQKPIPHTPSHNP